LSGNVPAGAGLSSSAALECSVAIGLDLLFKLGLSPQQLARAAQKAENDYVGMFPAESWINQYPSWQPKVRRFYLIVATSQLNQFHLMWHQKGLSF
jgi:hypothetical protein